MLFPKRERKRRHPLFTLTVTALATLGLCGIISASKNMITEKCEKIKYFFCKKNKNKACNCHDMENHSDY